MPERLPRYRTGSEDLDRALVDLLDAVGATDDRDVLFEILASGVRLARDDVERLDLKITSAALKEMRAAYRLFGAYQEVPKVTIFGSARTQPDDPLYAQARALAAALAGEGWMVVTGAGPGIMAAGSEGAGTDHAIGVNIRLPFEQVPTGFVADERLVEMKYFFTRKLMLVKESAGFVALPGGFGTLDEVFELLTLMQTGKSQPAPIVLLDVPGGTYWSRWSDFVADEVLSRGFIHGDDLGFYLITDDVDAACAEITGFYRTYHSIRWVGTKLVVRLLRAPTDAQLAALNERFAGLAAGQAIARTDPTPAEIRDEDHVELPRLILRLDMRHLPELRSLIDAVNSW